MGPCGRDYVVTYPSHLESISLVQRFRSVTNPDRGTPKMGHTLVISGNFFKRLGPPGLKKSQQLELRHVKL